MMNRRNFLRLSSGLIVASQLPPSLVWPFRKIFIPPPEENFLVGTEFFPWGAGNSEFEAVIAEELGKIWDKIALENAAAVHLARLKMGRALFDTPYEEGIFYRPEKVKAVDPFTYNILYGNASTDRA